MRKLISIMFVLVLLVTMTVPAVSAQESIEAQRMSREIAANNQYQKLLAHLTEEKLASHTRGTNTDYYGGAYINDNGDLTVCVTDTYDTSSGIVETYTRNDNISIVYVDYTYAEIYNEQQRIHNIYMQLRQNKAALSPGEHAVISNLRSTYIDEINNTLVVELSGLTSESISTFRSVFSNAPFLVFEDVSERTIANLTAAIENKAAEEKNVAAPTSVRATSLHPGGTIYNTASTSTRYALSIGYPVYFTVTGGATVRGFVTTGQHFDAGDYVYNENGTVIGQCVRSVFNTAGDGALIRITNSNYSISNITEYEAQELNTNYAAVPAVGTTAYMEGAGHINVEHAHLKIGEVTSRSARYYWDAYGFATTDLVLLQHTHLNNQPGPREGDLGAVVYKADGGIIGTLSWAFSDTGVISGSYVYSVTNAISQLDCDLWLEEEW